LGDVTILLDRVRTGDLSAETELLSLVYEKLRQLAGAHFRRRQQAVTLQPTALVHEAYLKLFGHDKPKADTRAHFYALASRVMRQVLIDHARAAASAKRSAGERVAWNTSIAVESSGGRHEFEILDVDRAITALNGEDAQLAQLIEMRYFGGMTAEETADVLSLSVHAVRHDLRLAQAWLRRELSR
jgi:RNA polymerase sigma-70 factor (ECF subfamily)